MFEEGYIIIGNKKIEASSIELDIEPTVANDMLQDASIWQGEIVAKKDSLCVRLIRPLNNREVYNRMKNQYLYLNEFVVKYKDD